ncbi:MAG: hypothetical protein RBQ97_04445 [Acholeplasma sp.]|nr:hypothetical protein [Acholeplasma sp.]
MKVYTLVQLPQQFFDTCTKVYMILERELIRIITLILIGLAIIF